MKALLDACRIENCATAKVFRSAVDSLFEEFSIETISSLITEIERLKKFEDWFTRLESATTAIDESFRDERDLALFSVYWAARLYMVPGEVTESDDDEFCEKTIRSGAETLMVGGRRLRDAAEKDEKGKPIIPFDWQYRSSKEQSK
ncbi:hypothetical protein ACVBEG_03045 [Pseudomonas sp. GG8]